MEIFKKKNSLPCKNIFPLNLSFSVPDNKQKPTHAKFDRSQEKKITIFFRVLSIRDVYSKRTQKY